MDDMALNNTPAIGDDQKWKSEVERAIEQLQKQVAVILKNSGVK